MSMQAYLIAVLMTAGFSSAWAQTMPAHENAEAGQALSSSPAMDMQSGASEGELRDPDAYSDGYDFDPRLRLRLADGARFGSLAADRLERQSGRDNTLTAYELKGWYGLDYDRLWLKGEGEIDRGRFQTARTELLWGHAIAPFWDMQVGVRHDSGQGPDRTWIAFGVEGIAPYWFDIEPTLYLGENGRTRARLEVQYDLLLTQKLILRPRLEANLSGKRDRAWRIGSGLSDLEVGLRLRYEIRREFAPYIGVDWAGKFGGTADFARADGERAHDTRLVVGLKFWF